MKSIDFLPKQYHEQAAKRKSKVWRYMVFGLFGSFILATAGAQFAWQLEAKRHSGQLDQMYNDAQTRRQASEALKVEYANDRQEAEFHTYLKSPWPRTQLLSEVASALSPAIRLSEIRIVREPKETTGPQKDAPPAPSLELAADAPPSAKAESDLKRLRF